MALQIAEARSGNVVNVDKAYAIRVSAFWRKIMHEFFADSTKNRSDIVLTDMFIDDFCREVMLNPRQFDVIVTSNLFGEMLAEVRLIRRSERYLCKSPSFSCERHH